MSNIAFGSVHLTRYSHSLSSEVAITVRPDSKNILDTFKSDRMKPEDVYLMDITEKEPRVKLIGKSKTAEKMTKAEQDGYLDRLARLRGAIKIFGRKSDIDTSSADTEKSIKDGVNSISALEYFQENREFYVNSMIHNAAQELGDEFDDAKFPEEKKSDNESDGDGSDGIDRTGYDSGYPVPKNEEVKSSNPFKTPDLASLNADDPDFDFDAGNYSNKTPLFETVKLNDTERTQRIIEKATEEGWSKGKIKEYVNKQNGDGNTALSLVRLPKSNNPEAVAKALKLAEILLDAGADYRIQNKKGESPRDLALKNREYPLLKCMSKYENK